MSFYFVLLLCSLHIFSCFPPFTYVRIFCVLCNKIKLVKRSFKAIQYCVAFHQSVGRTNLNGLHLLEKIATQEGFNNIRHFRLHGFEKM